MTIFIQVLTTNKYNQDTFFQCFLENSEAFVSDFLENIEEMFRRYYIHVYIYNINNTIYHI